ncbi:FeoA family protein [Acidomonas methanolica]|uniref:FeoA family protein n=1 Tax=Acidomonas methanolica TaxID=437 RepID=UPI00211A5D0E|nr:FeoA family protein [Acidomonas methanolica]MCQ9154689.1 ferrous iron transport protein A [Acidomonas methanolica]
MDLNALPKGGHAVIDRVEARGSVDPIMTRLLELGFVPGEAVEMVARGPLGADPVAVRVGTARFALRREEAARVHLRAVHLSPAHLRSAA